MANDQLLTRARERFSVQDYYGAIHILDELISSGGAFADAFHLLGLSFFLAGRTERALAAFDRALELNPRYVEALVHRGIVLNELGRTEEAEVAFAAARGCRGEDRFGIPHHTAQKLANRHAELGEAYAQAGSLDRAVSQYRAALELGPEFHDLRYRLARLLLESSRTLEAREELERVVRSRPDFSEARATLGLASYLSGDGVTARRIWTELLEEHPGDQRARAYLTMIERSQPA